MKTTIILILLASTLWVSAQSSQSLEVATPTQRWSFVERPHEWPHDPDGSNALARCMALAEKEIVKAQHFLGTQSYPIIEGGPKKDVPHTIVPYPGSPGDTWTIFFVKDSLKPYSIERKGNPDTTYLIQLDPRARMLHSVSSASFHISCEHPGSLRAFARPIRDKLAHTLVWDDNGHLETETVYDWANRGRTILKDNANQSSEGMR